MNRDYSLIAAFIGILWVGIFLYKACNEDNAKLDWLMAMMFALNFSLAMLVQYLEVK